MASATLVTGGAGYIGSPACVALIVVVRAGQVLDNLCSGTSLALARLQDICFAKPILTHGYILGCDCPDRVSRARSIVAVLPAWLCWAHFECLRAPGLKAASFSCLTSEINAYELTVVCSAV